MPEDKSQERSQRLPDLTSRCAYGETESLRGTETPPRLHREYREGLGPEQPPAAQPKQPLAPAPSHRLGSQEREELGLQLLYLAKTKTGCPVQFEYQINNK